MGNGVINFLYDMKVQEHHYMYMYYNIIIHTGMSTNTFKRINGDTPNCQQLAAMPNE